MKKKILYLGLDPTNFKTNGIVYHCPIIEIVPRFVPSTVFEKKWTHLLFTSKTAVTLFFAHFSPEEAKDKIIISVGLATASRIKAHGLNSIVARKETQEGVVALLETLDLKGASLLFPHSSSARLLISEYLNKKAVHFEEVPLYDVSPRAITLPPAFDEIVFTSPSTVHAFFSSFSHYAKDKKLTTIGEITQKALDKYLSLPYPE